MILPIRAYGDPILHKQAKTVSGNSAELQDLINSMILTMRRADGAGLAAPQIGKQLRIFVADLTEALSLLPEYEQSQIPQQPMVCINPKIIFSSQEKEEFEKECFSISNYLIKI